MHHRGLGLDHFHGAGITLLGHDGTAAAVFVAESNESEFSGGEKDQGLGEPA